MKKPTKLETSPRKHTTEETTKPKKGENTMAHRKKMNMRKDKHMFNVTARKTKAINLSQKPMRGGIRL